MRPSGGVEEVRCIRPGQEQSQVFQRSFLDLADAFLGYGKKRT